MTARSVGFAMLACVWLLTACNGDRTTSALPGAPSSLPSPSASTFTYWTANGTVSSVTEPLTCLSHLTVGRTLGKWAWRVTITSDEILMEQDDDGLSYIPFAGTLKDRQFTATYTAGTHMPPSECWFKAGTLAGSFSEDLSSFEAVQTLVYASSAGESSVQWRWIGSRCPNC